MRAKGQKNLEQDVEQIDGSENGEKMEGGMNADQSKAETKVIALPVKFGYFFLLLVWIQCD